MNDRTFPFAGHRMVTDPRLLPPRTWTVAQSDWARELLALVPEGPVLELCAGAGHIGLAAVHGTSRSLVAVDREPMAMACAMENARRLGMAGRVEARCGGIDVTLQPGETFGLVIADPPWVPHASVGDHPEDPSEAIDGGDDGLETARVCLTVIERQLKPGGIAVLQLGRRGQVERLHLPQGLDVREVHTFPRGVLVRIDREPAPPSDDAGCPATVPAAHDVRHGRRGTNALGHRAP